MKRGIGFWIKRGIWLFVFFLIAVTCQFAQNATSVVAGSPECKEPYASWSYTHPTLALKFTYPCNLRVSTFPDAVILKEHFNRTESPRDFLVLTTGGFTGPWRYACGEQCFDHLMQATVGSTVQIGSTTDSYEKLDDITIGGERASKVHFVEATRGPNELTLHVNMFLMQVQGGPRWIASCVAMNESQLAKRSKICDDILRTVHF